MMKMSLHSVAAVAICLSSTTVLAQTVIGPAPATPSVVTPAAAMPVAPVADIVVGAPEVTLQLHPVTHFGQAKQVFVHGGTSMMINGRHNETPKSLGPVQKADRLELQLELKAGYFFFDVFAAGLTGQVTFANTTGSQGVDMQVGPFVALNVPMHHHLTFFPSLAGLYGYDNNINKGTNISTFQHSIALELQLTVLFHVTEHFSLSVSPYANQSLYTTIGAGRDKDVARNQGLWSTSYGAKLGLLFWR